MTQSTPPKTEDRHFYSLFALQAYITVLAEAQKSYITFRNGRPKPGKWIYGVRIYHAA